VAAARINWKSTFISGSGNVSSSGSFTGTSGSVGLITATLDNYSATIEVIPTSIQTLKAELTLPEGGYVYDGNAKEPEVVITSETELVRDVDYTVSYVNNINAGNAMVIITALDTGKCSGSKILTFEIAAASIAESDILLSGKGAEVAIKVILGETELVADVDYTVSVEISEETNAGLITVTGKGNYKGTKTRAFALDKQFNEHVSQNEGAGAWFARNAVWIAVSGGAVLVIGSGVGIFFLAKAGKLGKIGKFFAKLFKKKK
jgi:hypothetical protein